MEEHTSPWPASPLRWHIGWGRTLFRGWTPRPFESRSSHHGGSHHLRRPVAHTVLRTESVRNGQTARTHMSIISAHRRIHQAGIRSETKLRCGTAAEHLEMARALVVGLRADSRGGSDVVRGVRGTQSKRGTRVAVDDRGGRDRAASKKERKRKENMESERLYKCAGAAPAEGDALGREGYMRRRRALSWTRGQCSLETTQWREQMGGGLEMEICK